MRLGLAAFILVVFAQLTRVSAATTISIDVRDVQLTDMLALLSAESGENIIADESLARETVSLRLNNVTPAFALSVLAQTHNLEVRRLNGAFLLRKRQSSTTDAYRKTQRIYFLRYANPVEVAKEMQAVLPPGAAIVGDKTAQIVIVYANAQEAERIHLMVTALDRAPPSTSTRSYSLRYAKASDVAAVLKTMLPVVASTAEDDQNRLIVNGSQENQDMAAELVRTIDMASPQVLLEVRVADIEPSNEQSDVGMQLGGYDANGQPTPGALTYAFARNSVALNARFSALVSSGHAQILATPKLLTLNGHEANLLIGETYPVAYYDVRTGGQQVQFVDIGVKLRMTPQIGSDGTVTAEMHPEYSAIEGFVGGYPILTNRKVDSTLRVRDNETIVLGGLLRDIDSATVSKIPGLGDIPVLGRLFQNRSAAHRHDEVVFLITPHIIYPSR